MKLPVKFVVALAGVAALAAASVVYVVQAKANSPERQVAGTTVAVDSSVPVMLGERGRLLFRNEAPGPGYGNVASVPVSDPGGARRISSLACERFFTAVDRGLCLAKEPTPRPGAVARFVDAGLGEVKRVEVPGIPNRAKLSPGGRMGSWTTFVTGDSYSKPGTFSTRTAIMDRERDELSSNIEGIPLRIGDVPQRGEDVNYWGVTFAADERMFFATVATGGRTYLVRGDNEAWNARTLRENAECPSLSPDGTKLAFKKRVADGDAQPWREHVLDLATMRETPLAETRSVDDQVVWLDNDTIAYGLPRGNGKGSDVWSVPADGSGAARLLVPLASSPSVTTAAR
ncbi:hypothetical protein [Amycolatopsis regifaucium]|uniref:TolB n=1 Tax=Amycolatopsis regifaucium TaxID=546365 RepID=A0A154MNN0_9PSEU|nr:hypothetical protein [Amycolatopsis regifaucium]KZB85914.1 TolB [Amycolatopsis regifaucium]OKA04807.1 hypothetical protein ATP06_0227315 [Amycolatopsis regifaucium]SFH71499.1 hypothetical protein SAMN04489731_10622 [Amycolatopsis regifaucium]